MPPPLRPRSCLTFRSSALPTQQPIQQSTASDRTESSPTSLWTTQCCVASRTFIGALAAQQSSAPDRALAAQQSSAPDRTEDSPNPLWTTQCGLISNRTGPCTSHNGYSLAGSQSSHSCVQTNVEPTRPADRQVLLVSVPHNRTN